MLTEGVSWFFLHSLQNSKNTAWPSASEKKNDGHKKHHSFFWTNGRKMYELSIILLENIKVVILATNKKIIKEEIT